jgi:hypothetical protein
MFRDKETVHMKQQGWNLDALKEHIDGKLGDFAHRLDGFPQEYASANEVESLRKSIEDMRSDHVQRREIEQMQTQMDEARGRRNAGGIAIAVVVTLVTMILGWMVQNSLTQAEVSAQIQREAPWNSDKTEIKGRILTLERELEQARSRIAALEVTNRFFCATRTSAGLPGC